MSEEKLLPPAEESPSPEPGSMGILEHLRELRWAIVWSLLSIAALSSVTLYFSNEIFQFAAQPVLEILQKQSSDQKLIFTSPPEGLLTLMKVGLFSGFILSTPFWLFFFGRFIWVGLYPQERRFIAVFVFFGSFLFACGTAFTYFIMLPLGLNFLIPNYTSATIKPLISIKEYFSFVMALVLAFGLAFQLPLVMYLLGRMGVINARQLLKAFRWAVVLIFIVAAVLTPPDVVSQMCLAIPLLVLYFSGVVLVALFGKKKPPTPIAEEIEETPTAD